MRNPQQMIKMLQSAINRDYNKNILYNRQQWYSKDQDRPVTKFVIKEATWSESKQEYIYTELFSAYSQIQCVLFLRDMLYELRGDPIPEPTEEWKKAKETYYRKKEERDGENNKATGKERSSKKSGKKVGKE